ncbi:MAG: protein phosphatase 2C domain-containing protein [Myxococcota bacterium]|nr:protein phosphatase 2C domain-containing protein [Myxococcota bacterium]
MSRIIAVHTEDELTAERPELDRVNVDPIELVEPLADCRVVGVCHVGRVRSENQDFMGHFFANEGHLLVVADGMGGHNGGWEASHTVVDACAQAFEEWTQEKSPLHLLSDCVQLSNTLLIERSVKQPELQGMGSTFVGVYVWEGKAWFANLGDSRAYLIRKGTMTRISRDHSRVGMMVEAGLLTEEAARKHPMSNVLEMALGVEDFVAPEMSAKPIALEEGDRFLLCSDGLWGLVPDEEILELFSDGDLQVQVDSALNLALERGGNDNITIALLDYKGAFFDGKLRDSEGLVPRNRANLLAWELVMAAVVFICVGFTWAALQLQQTY